MNLVSEGINRITPRAVVFGADFYDRLFARAPALRARFPVEMAPQILKLMQTLTSLTDYLNDPQSTAKNLRRLGAHQGHLGAGKADYDLVRDVLLETLENWLEQDFTPEARLAWTETLDAVNAEMLAGAQIGTVAG